MGTTLSSSLFQLSDSLWMLDVRENIGKLVEYIEHNSSDQIYKDTSSEQFQLKVIGKTIHDSSFDYKFKQAAYALTRIKKEYPELLEQLIYAGKSFYNITSYAEFIFFKQTERGWHIPTGNRQTEIMPVHSFILFSPSLARTASFETPEADLHYEQFRYGSVENIQFQGAFSKVRRNRGGKTIQKKDFASFGDIRFLFRTVKDAKIIHDAKRLEDFSFVTTSHAGADSFKIASYFILTGNIGIFSHFSLQSQIPANMIRVIFYDATGSLEFQMAGEVLQNQMDPMGKSIGEFFHASTDAEKVKLKDSFVTVLARWALGDNLPEILYMKKIGDKYGADRLEFFYLLAYLNSRKKVLYQTLEGSFQKVPQDHEYILVKNGYAYFVQEGWEKNIFSKLIDMYDPKGSFSGIGEDFQIGLYFLANPDAEKLYLSKNPEKDFSEVFNAHVSSWSYPRNKFVFSVTGQKVGDSLIDEKLEGLVNTQSGMGLGQEVRRLAMEAHPEDLMTMRPCKACQNTVLLRRGENLCMSCSSGYGERKLET